MKILAIDTTSSPVSAAILTDGALTGEFYLNTKSTHSRTLMPITEALLKSAEISIDDIDVFAVNAGPGSFTGVRIGVSTIKGLSMPKNKPCAAVSALESMAYCMPFSSGTVCAVMDARCSQVYNALFTLKNGEVIRECDDRVLSIEELYNELKTVNDKIYIVGDGASLFYNSTDKRDNMVLVQENIRFQHAYGTAKCAEKMYNENRLCTSAHLRPIYLRIPQAERELKARQEKERKEQK